MAALGLEPGFGAVNPLIESHVSDFGLNRLAVPIGTSKTIANQAIIAGINNRESIGEIAARLRAVGATNSGYRSRLIARTEVVRSANVGRELSWKASQLPLVKRWISGLTETTRESHAALHMKTVKLNESFTFNAGLSPFRDGSPSVPGTTGVAAHDCNCILPGQFVSGQFVAGVRSQYSGDVVTINTLKGSKLSVTPNHPILTSRGWVPAGDIRQGDSLLSHNLEIKSPVTTDQVNKNPTLIENVFTSLAQAGVSYRRWLRPDDLHGDALNVASEVEIVSIDRQLMLQRKIESLELFKEFFLKFTHIGTSSFGSRTGSSGIVRIPPCLPRFAKHLLKGSRVFPSFDPQGSLCVGATPSWHSSFSKPSTDDATANAKFFAQLILRNPGLVSIDYVTEVGNSNYSGHVYDLQSMSGWMVAQGISISNCVCSSTAFDPEHKKRAFDFGSQEHVLWQKAVDEERAPWERRAIEIIESYFEDINRETERIIERL